MKMKMMMMVIAMMVMMKMKMKHIIYMYILYRWNSCAMKKWVTEYNMKIERDRLHPLNDDDKDDGDTKGIIISNDNNSASKNNTNSFNSNSYSTNNNACGSIEVDQYSVLKAVNNFRDNIKAAGVVLSDQVLCALDEILLNAEVGYEATMKTESRISSGDFRKNSRKDASLIEELCINKQNSNSNNTINKNKNGKRKKQKVDDDTTSNNDKSNNIDLIYYDYRDDGYHYKKSSSSFSSLLQSPLMTTMTEPRLPSSITLGSSFQLQMPTEVDDDFLMNLCSSSGSKSREQYAEEDQMCAEQLVRILHTMKVTNMMMMIMRRSTMIIRMMMTRRKMVDV
jgi:hypothetical protein